MLLLFLFSLVQAGSGVPASLLDAASGDPMSFLSRLADARIPAGLEIREADIRPIRPLAGGRVAGGERQQALPVERVIAAFNKQHSDYVASVENDVVVVRPVRGRSDYLSAKPFTGAITGTGLMRVAEKMFAPLDRTLDQSGGRPGSRLGQPGVEVDYGDQIQVGIDAGSLTVIDALVRLSRQAPGHAWVVVTSGEPSKPVRYGFVHAGASATWMPIQPAP
jgi:hypothetical protein